MSAFYNENDPRAAAWLRELISAVRIPAGVVDGRETHEDTLGELSMTLPIEMVWPDYAGEPAVCLPQSTVLHGSDEMTGVVTSDDGRECPVRWPSAAFAVVRFSLPGFRGAWNEAIQFGAREKAAMKAMKRANTERTNA